MNGAVRR